MLLLLAACGGGGGSTSAPIPPGILGSITITPPSLYLEATKSYSGLKATGNYTDGTTADLTSQVVWSSSSSAIASVTLAASGVSVTAASSPPATTTISAVFKGLTGSAMVDIVTGASPNLHFARGDHTATLLQDGTVLVVGGYTSPHTTPTGALDSAELYRDTTIGPAGTLGTWTVIPGSLSTGRGDHTATLLQNGKVLVVGGVDAAGHDVASAELYDPVKGTWSATGNLITPRTYHTATLLTNGKVLIAGGVNQALGQPATAEIYDPSTGLFSATGSLITKRQQHTATLLSDGSVLVVGGYYNDVAGNAIVNASAEIYHPTGIYAGMWTPTGSLSTTPRLAHTATLLSDGTVLVAGGENLVSILLGFTDLATAEIYAGGTWTSVGSLNTARHNHTATLITTSTDPQYGKVLVIGGASAAYSSTPYIEWYDPIARTWSQQSATGRVIHTATELNAGINKGKVLAVGGNDNAGAVLSSAELLN